EQRARFPFGRVTDGPQPLAVAHTDAGLNGVFDPVRCCGRLDEADSALERRERILFQAVGEGQIEHQLGIRRALDIGEELRVDGEHELAPNGPELVDQAVVDEQPVPMPIGMAVRLLHRGAGGRPHVGQKKRGLDVAGEVAQVLIVPGRRAAAIDAGPLACSVPADSEAIAVGRLGPQPRVQALIDEAMLGLDEQLLDQHRLAMPRHPPTHSSLLSIAIPPRRDPGAGLAGWDAGARPGATRQPAWWLTTVHFTNATSSGSPRARPPAPGGRTVPPQQQHLDQRPAPPTELTRHQIEELEGRYGNRFLLEPPPDHKLPK